MTWQVEVDLNSLVSICANMAKIKLNAVKFQ